jgi:hypothetical protein
VKNSIHVVACAPRRANVHSTLVLVCDRFRGGLRRRFEGDRVVVWPLTRSCRGFCRPIGRAEKCPSTSMPGERFDSCPAPTDVATARHTQTLLVTRFDSEPYFFGRGAPQPLLAPHKNRSEECEAHSQCRLCCETVDSIVAIRGYRSTSDIESAAYEDAYHVLELFFFCRGGTCDPRPFIPKY